MYLEIRGIKFKTQAVRCLNIYFQPLLCPLWLRITMMKHMLSLSLCRVSSLQISPCPCLCTPSFYLQAAVVLGTLWTLLLRAVRMLALTPYHQHGCAEGAGPRRRWVSLLLQVSWMNNDGGRGESEKRKVRKDKKERKMRIKEEKGKKERKTQGWEMRKD